MLSYFKILSVLLLLALLAACGGSGVNATTVSATTTVPFSTAEVSGKTLYLASALSNQPLTLIFGATDTDRVDSNGVLYVSTDQGADSVAYQFVRMQKEKEDQPEDVYWLVYDQNKIVNRLYLDQTLAAAYLSSISRGPNKALMGGSIQGTEPLPLGDPVTVSTFAGTVGTVGSIDDVGPAARFYQPLGITTDGTNLYVADYYNYTIRMIDPSQRVTLFAGKTRTRGSSNGTANDGVEATFDHPSAVTTDGKNLYVADSYNFTVRKIVFGNNGTHSTFTLAGRAGYSGAVDAVGDRARFNILSGITTDGTNLYVTDSYNTIRKIVISSGAVSTLAGKAGTVGSRDGIGEDARFDLPTGITTDGSFLYVTDFNNRTIRKITIATGKVETIVGNAKADPPPFDVDIISEQGHNKALFYQPHGITTDGPNLYVTDSYPYKNTIYKIDKSSLIVTRLAGVSGTAGQGHTDASRDSTFYSPIGLTTDGTSLYVTDTQNNDHENTHNNTIRKIQ